jgi:uncharacterized protein (DUF697 family)
MLPDILERALRAGFRRAYVHVQVDPERYLRHIRRAYSLPIQSWSDMQGIDEETLHPIAQRVITSAKRTAALEGTGLGFGGLLTIVPDMGILSAITIRMLLRLSLIYGFEYATEEEVTDLWLAAASAAGVDLGRELIEKQAMERVVPRVIDRIAARVGAEVAEKWSGRLIPILSAGIGGSLNYYFVRSWGRRAQCHFLGRHRQARARTLESSDVKPFLLNPAVGHLNS